MDKPNWSPEVQAALCELLNQQIRMSAGTALYSLTGLNGFPGVVVVAIGPNAEAIEKLVGDLLGAEEVLFSELN